MPNRILHERICVSETVARLSAEEERFFYRLIVQCDDYGRFDGRASVIRARCFALQLDVVTDDHVEAWMQSLADAGLVVLYVVDGRAFLRVTTWERYQQTRAKRSKYPAPGDLPTAPASNGNQMPAIVPVSGIREARSEKREPEIENRESLRDSTPQPPPTEGEHPPTPRKRGARKPRGSANGAAHVETDSSESSELQPATAADLGVLNLALAAIGAGGEGPAWAANVERLGELVPLGRALDGGLHLRAPPGLAEHARRFRPHLARALLDAGDADGSRVSIEGS